eukprot:667178-Pyramimonas_sp.AAC.1
MTAQGAARTLQSHKPSRRGSLKGFSLFQLQNTTHTSGTSRACPSPERVPKGLQKWPTGPQEGPIGFERAPRGPHKDPHEGPKRPPRRMLQQ